MFYHLLYPLHEYISVFNIFRYITFRAAYAGVTALLVCLILGPPLIRRLRAFKVKQAIRQDGPATHFTKEGTPTMGGLLILIAVVVSTLLWGNLANRMVVMALLSTLWLGAIGFLDDYLRVVKKHPKGLKGRYKLLAQGVLGLTLGLVLYLAPVDERSVGWTNVPFLKDMALYFGPFYVVFVMLVITGSSNAVNLTDGLDGLAIGSVSFVALAFGVLSYLTGHIKIAEYLNIHYMEGCGELSVYCGAVMGAALGFLWFNCHPAEVFMGDTGALALGGALGTVAVLIKRELLLVIVGGVFVIETLSVILQVASFKLRGRRIFKMTPIHHHFELLGWPETRVVVRFWIVAAVLALVTITTLKIQ
ncbi:MAG: phospho-N-acetylmuramoyl-pentapeptide-transferase [Candidatus Eisenbacteria bacterium]|nr:phospho-N-acetylmuramoyl-pentapeptide-transferase [Candidatus Eisenbacteria bacterium]